VNREHNSRPAATGRVVHVASHYYEVRAAGANGNRSFATGDAVRSLTHVKNDGIYPHKRIGEILVHPGDAGHVHESWSFLGEVYYTVEFAQRMAVVIMRGKEMEKTAAG
jgi:nitrogen fixation protein NifZ